MSRLAIPAAFLLVAGAVIWSAFLVPEGTEQSVLINLGTEIIGIVITVAVVEYFFERRRHLERARQIAWSALHAIEHAVWVWLGGPREIDSDQLLGILRAVDDGAPLPDFTQNLLLGIGTRAKQALHNDIAAIEAMPHLMRGYEELARLNAIREGGRVKSPRKVADILEQATTALARSLDQPLEPMPSRLIRYVDAAESAQELRYFGGSESRSTAAPNRAGGPGSELF